MQRVNLSTKGSATIFIFKINITFPIKSSRYCTKKLQNYNPSSQSTLRLVSQALGTRPCNVGITGQPPFNSAARSWGVEQLKDKDRERKGKKGPEGDAQKAHCTHSASPGRSLQEEPEQRRMERKERRTSIGQTLSSCLEFVGVQPRETFSSGLGPKFHNTSFFRQPSALEVLGSQSFAFGIEALCITESLCVPFWSHKLELWYLLILYRLQFARSTLWVLISS